MSSSWGYFGALTLIDIRNLDVCARIPLFYYSSLLYDRRRGQESDEIGRVT